MLNLKKLAKSAQFLSQVKEPKIYPGRTKILNLLLSGKFDGGTPAGITTFVGAAKSFKTLFALKMASDFQKTNPNGIIVFYDIEMGTTKDYLKQMGLDTDRVMIPMVSQKNGSQKRIVSHEEFKISINQLLGELEEDPNYEPGDVMIILDSIGALILDADNKAVDDGEIRADAGRTQKMIKSIFMSLNARIKSLDIPLVVISSVYASFNTYGGGTEWGGGSGIKYATDNGLEISKSREKDTTGDLAGFKFTLRPKLSRIIREGMAFPVFVYYGKPIQDYTGLADLGKEVGLIESIRIGVAGGIQYKGRPDIQCKVKGNEENSEFWEKVFKETDFAKIIENRVSLSNAVLESNDTAIGVIDEESTKTAKSKK